MDITSFINSKDIRDYHRKIGYQYSALEAAWLVYQCQRKTLEEKLEAWQWIIDNMPDMPIDCVRLHKEYRGISVHVAIRDFIDLRSRFWNDFSVPKDGWVYTYKYYCNCGDGGVRCYDHAGVFTSLDKCIKFITCNEDAEDVTSIMVYRYPLDCCDAILTKFGCAFVTISGKILDVDPWLGDNGENYALAYLFWDMWFEFPVPFKKGDIVTLASEYSKRKPIVLESALIPPGEDAEEYRKKRKENGGDTSDMCFWGYAIDVDDYIGYNGVYTDNFWNYMDMEYYTEELIGRQRVLKPISAWLKGELGDDLCLLLAAYHRVMLEDALSQTVPCLYTNEGLRKVGLPERER